MLFKRVYLSPEDSGAKSTSQPAAPAGAQPAPAQGAAETPKPQAQQQSATVDVAALAREIRDGVFADLRKAGVLKKSAIREMDAGGKAGEQPAQPAADLTTVRSFDRAMSRLGFAKDLEERQYARAEKAFVEERPDDVDGWIKDYFKGFGGQAAAAKPEDKKSTTATPQNERPASDAGSPAGPTRPINEIDLLKASDSDVQHIVSQKGFAGLKAMLANQLKGKTLKLVE